MHVGNARPAPWKRRKESPGQKKKEKYRKGSEQVATFRDFDSFDRLVVYEASAFFDEFVALNTEV
jgi:hypothetical protein